MMKKTLMLVSMAAVVAVLVAAVAGGFGASDMPAVYASRVAGISAAGETGIQIQNLDQGQPATISADFYRSNGGFATTITLPQTPAGAAANIWLPGEDSLPTGAYAAIINADRQIAAIARTDWPTSAGAAIYSNVLPGNNVALPLAVRQYSAVNQSSLVSIQNTDTGSAATVTVKVFEKGQAAPKVQNDYQIPPGTSITLDLDQDTEFTPLGSGFLGSLTVESATEIGVQSFVDIQGSDKAVYAFEGVPSEMAATTLYAPLFRAKQYPNSADPNSGRLDTGISVVNPGTSSVQVTITYYGAGNSCTGQTYQSDPQTIEANSSHVFYQGAFAAENLPENCYGSAVINSQGGPVLAIVNDSQNEGQTSAAFNAVTADQGARTVALPLWRNEHLDGIGLSTGISIMNVGTDRADITITFSQNHPNGTSTVVSCATCGGSAGPNETFVFWPPAYTDAGLPKGAYGSATINSTQPVAVIVNDVVISGAMDMATYNGIKADAQ